MIKLRIDVDYPYPSRQKSFFHTLTNAKLGKDYLKNSKILARMINESPTEVKAYWFFTLKTIPDKQLLMLLNAHRHEIALHVVNDPFTELEILQKATRRTIDWYTIHGTSRLLGRFLWGRWKTKAPQIPSGFPLESFHKVPTLVFDALCYEKSMKEAVKIAEYSIAQGKVLEIHPEWLFQRGRINHRGPYCEQLGKILNSDENLKNIVTRKKLFFKIANGAREYENDLTPSEILLEKLKERGVDIFTLIERRWHQTIPDPPVDWIKTEDNIALLEITEYDAWWSSIGKKTRNMVRKAEKSGVETKIVAPDTYFAEGVWKIYNETPIRQGRAFPHFGITLETVKKSVQSSENTTFIGAYFEKELIGFIQLVHGDHVIIVSQILSLQGHWEKGVNNALLAKAAEVCSNQRVKWLMYGRIGNHPSLDRFKQNHGFKKFTLKRYYIPLTMKGKIAAKIGLHRPFKDTIPQSIKYALIPVYNWISRAKTVLRHNR